MYFVKGSTSKRSWLVYNSFLTAVNETIKCKDDMYIYTAVSNWPIRVPPQTAIQAVF